MSTKKNKILYIDKAHASNDKKRKNEHSTIAQEGICKYRATSKGYTKKGLTKAGKEALST